MKAPQVAPHAHQLTSRALDWLYRMRHLNTIPDDIDPHLIDPPQSCKSLVENALAASLVLREGAAAPSQVEQARQLLDYNWAQLRHGNLLYECQLQDPTLPVALEFYAPFHRSGYRHAPLEVLLNHLQKMYVEQTSEFIANRRLSIANAARTIGLDTPLDWSYATSATWLGSNPQPWALDWQTAYYMTHTMFHLTDWGCRPEGTPEPIRDFLSTWLPVWVETWLENQDWDLIAELLMVDSCLPEPVCTSEVWEQLAAIQHEDGLVPRDNTPVDDPAEGEELDHYRANQHTTVVAAMAGTLALSRAMDTARPPAA